MNYIVGKQVDGRFMFFNWSGWVYRIEQASLLDVRKSQEIAEEMEASIYALPFWEHSLTWRAIHEVETL
jgi:hypothetical protein